MSVTLSGFDEFIQHFRSEAIKTDLDTWADAIYVMLWQAPTLVEKRFQGGLALWSVWVISQLLTKKSFAISSSDTTTESQATPYGFRFLSTPAHCDSLNPLLQQVMPAQRTLYNYGDDSSPEERIQLTFSIPQNLNVLGWRASLRVFRVTLKTTRKIRYILSRIPGQANRPVRGSIPRLAEMILRHGLDYERLNRTPCAHRAVFLTYELIPEAKAWVQWSRKSGARVFHVMHGQRLPTYQVTMATDILLFSKVDEPWFRERVDPQIKIWTIGHPRLESIRRDVGPPQRHGVSRLPRIAFFSQPAEGDYGRELRRNDWRILIGLKGHAEVRFRLHPRESKYIANDDLRELGADFIEFSEAGLKEDLLWCDAVASSWSTVSMEAAACGRGIFWTCSTPERYEASQELRDHGIGILISDAAHWDQPLEAWNRGEWAAPIVVPEARLRELGMIGDMDIPWLERLGLE